jgi:hypothetical protein
VLLIATPVRGAAPLSGDVKFGYAESRARLAQMMPVSFMPTSVGFSCDIVRARNRIAAYVLRELPDVDRVFWWDDDVWPEDLRLVQRMIDTGEDLIGLPYTNKKTPIRWVHQFLNERPQVRDNLLEVRGVGFGLTLTSRRCLEKLSASARQYTDHPNPHKIANLFGQLYDPPIEGSAESEDDMLLSEDFSFCKRWRALGGKVLIYAGAGNMTTHAGPYGFSARDMPGGLA